MLNDVQFGELHQQLRNQGGFTVDLRTGTQPSEGIAMATDAAYEETHRPATPGDIRGYAERNYGALTEPGMHMGAWEETAEGEEQGTDFLDRSYVVPGSSLDPFVHARAINEMIKRDQRAAWDLGRGVEVRNPYHGSEDPAGDIKRDYERSRDS